MHLHINEVPFVDDYIVDNYIVAERQIDTSLLDIFSKVVLALFDDLG